MLTYTTVGEVRAIIAQSEAAADQADRLVDRMYKADLLPAGDKQHTVHPAQREEAELNDLAPLGASTMAEPLRRLQATLEGMSPEARREVQAIALIGAGEFAAREWDAALTAAESRQTEAEPRAMAEDADLAPHLAKGLYLLKLT
ncbi:MAG TPA: DUF3775 domain-containing protein [Acetobacteraceae bacterium]|jgi:hypothetical protein|nr:DUF3775 domain-containing protein [Acetobacteraceae bacterium]